MKKPQRYAGSPADQREDARNAKKNGMSVKAWQKSAGDKKADAAGQCKLDAKAKSARKR